MATKQASNASTGFELVNKHIRKRESFDEMTLVRPWTKLVVMVYPFALAIGGTGGCSALAVETMPRI